MWITTTSSGTTRLYAADLDAEISFSSNGTAQVAEDVGEALIEQYDSIERRDASSSSDGSSEDGNDIN